MTTVKNSAVNINYEHLIKILLIGDSGVGKTSLLHKYFDDNFNSSFIPTIGVDFIIRTIEIEGRRIRMQIWDTAGQERFDAITSSFYRGAMGIAMVYDLTDSKSFFNIGKWLRNIDEHASENVLKLLIANKLDKEDLRVVTYNNGERLADEHNIPFIETSAKTNYNVKRAFNEFALRIVEILDEKKQKNETIPVLSLPRQGKTCHLC